MEFQRRNDWLCVMYQIWKDPSYGDRVLNVVCLFRTLSDNSPWDLTVLNGSPGARWKLPATWTPSSCHIICCAHLGYLHLPHDAASFVFMIRIKFYPSVALTLFYFVNIYLPSFCLISFSHIITCITTTETFLLFWLQGKLTNCRELHSKNHIWGLLIRLHLMPFCSGSLLKDSVLNFQKQFSRKYRRG